MHNFKLIIAYDGTNYSGWQIQSTGIGIQDLMTKYISMILGQEIVVVGSGRTDAGVHARGQIAHFHYSKPIDIYRFKHSLNRLLPKDIRVCEMQEVPLDFHARHGTTGKVYHYHLNIGREDPFTRLYRLHIHEKIDLDLLQLAAKQFVGTKDFTSFANEAHLGSAARNPVRHLKRLDVVIQSTDVRLEFEADGFLYKMVRNITGTLLEVATAKRSIDSIQEIFTSKNRQNAGRTAPPHGLFLMEVYYPKNDSAIRPITLII